MTQIETESRIHHQLDTNSIDAAYPLSSLQQGMLFHTLFNPNSGVDVEQMVITLREELDLPSLHEAWLTVIQRHGVLRTGFNWDEPDPIQQVYSHADPIWQAYDWRAEAKPDQETKLEDYLWNDRQIGFDMRRPPLLRFAIMRMDAEEYRLIWSFHHAILDGRAFVIVLKEVFAFYQALRDGDNLDLVPPRPFGDYISWLGIQDLLPSEEYWRKSLKGLERTTSLSELISNGRKDNARSYKFQEARLSAATTAALREMANRYQLTPNTIFQGAWAVLLSWYTGNQDVVFGVTRACRKSAMGGADGVVGLFINTLPLRVSVPGSASVLQWLDRLRTQNIDVRPHEHTPLVVVQQCCEAMSNSPLFDSILVFENFLLDSALREQGGEWKRRHFELRGQTNYPLTVGAFLDTELLIKFSYYTQLFSDTVIARMLGHLRTLIEAIVSDPKQQISNLSMLTEPERQAIVFDYNATYSDLPQTAAVHHLFEEAARAHPDAAALVFEQDELTYDQLNARANQLAHYLQARGVGPDVLVGICVERSAEFVVGMLSILKAGGAYVPLDTTLPKERLAWMLQDCNARLLLTEHQFADIDDRPDRVICLDTEAPAIAQECAENTESGVCGSNLVYIIYTSGSTGRPKGVAVEHKQLLNYVQGVSNRLGLTPGASYATVSTFAADLGNTVVFPSLCSGGCLHIMSLERAMDPGLWREYLTRRPVDALKIVPSHLSALLGSGKIDQEMLPRQVLVLGGEASHQEFVDRIVETAPELRVLNHYGPTETTVGVLTYAINAGSSCEQPGCGRIPLGRPLPNSRAYVLNTQRQTLPVGVPGELYIGGAGVSRGYLNRPDLTAERFLPDPFSMLAGARMYRTGDVARYLADGNLEFLGRADHQVKVRGYRIELGEIESVLLQHPSVCETLVLARQEDAAEQRLIAYVVTSDERPAVDDLRAYLTTLIPEYMVPAAFVFLEALPLTHNGKVDRNALPAPAEIERGKTGVAPRTPLEEGLAEIWREVLRVEQVGAHDNFFDLGGHSLLATQVASRIRKVFRIELPVRVLFEARTLAQLAERVAGKHGETASSTPPLQPKPRHGVLPLSFAQQRLWFIHQLDPDSPAYNAPHAVRLTGRLDENALQQGLQQLIERHEVLRTTFVLTEEGPGQVIHESAPSPLQVVDLRSLPPEVRETEANIHIQAEAWKPFDLSEGPVLRFMLLRLDEEEYIALLTLHHIVSDGWSSAILKQELSSLYNGTGSAKGSQLPDLPIQYADYASWQREWLQGGVLEQQLIYWRERLAGAPTLLELQADRPRPPVQSYRGATRRLAVSPELTRSLKTLCQREGVTQFMVLLSAFQVLLYRYSGQEDFVVGTAIANRTRTETEGLIGCFFNSLALRSDLSGDPSVRELLGRVRETALGAYAHQDMPFEKLVDELKLERSLSNSPLFQIMFVMQNTPAVEWRLKELRIESIPTEGPTAKFDLMVYISEDEGGLLVSLEYNTDIFNDDRIGRLLAHYESLLEGFATEPASKISRLTMLTEAERRCLLVEWNDTVTEYPDELGVHQLFERQVEQTPDAAAVVFQEKSISYRTLNARANQLAHHLRRNGVGPDVLVGLYVERSLEMMVGLLGILKSGGAYVPLDTAYPRERLAFMLEDSQVSVILTQQRLREDLPEHIGRIISLDQDQEWTAGEITSNPISGLTPDNLAYVIYTSGSTGRPKGAMLTHRGLTNYLTWCVDTYQVAQGEGSPVYSSIGFDLTITGLFSPLLAGRKVVFVKEAEGIESLKLALGTEYNYSLVKITPAHLELLRQHLTDESMSARTRAFIVGGEALHGESLDYWRINTPNVRIVNEYGPTEAVVGCCVYSVLAADCPNSSVPIGRPIANTHLYLLDRALEPVPVGVPGELYIGGAGLARGYLNRPDLTAERFVPDPFGSEPGARLYRTGDTCLYQQNGNLEYLGRIDNQVKLHGYRIELGEIESMLGRHPAIVDAIVLVREDIPGDRRLTAYVSADPQARPSRIELRAYLKTQLPDYMVPSAIIFLDAFPLTHNGKVDRKALPAPDESRPEMQDAYTSPTTSVEQSLADIWSKVLRLERVGIHDNFFELGGDSILSIQIISRANQAGLYLTPRQMFEHQTIARLAAVAGAKPEPKLEQTSVTGEVQLTPIQHWFFERDLPEPHYYNHAHILELRSRVSPRAVKSALDALLLHHDALRLRYVRTSNGWSQHHIEDNVDWEMSTIDLSAVPAAQQSAAISQAAERVQASLNLETGQLVKAVYFDLGQMNNACLLLVIHHLAVDGISWRVIFSDLTQALEQLGRGEAAAFANKTTSFQYWAKRLDEYAQTNVLLQELDYWTADVRSSSQELPRDYPGGKNALSAERTVEKTISASETRALLQDVPSIYHTQINDVLLTALGKALGKWTGADAVLLDLEGHGREPLFDEVDLSRTVGWFTTMFPVLLELPVEATTGELLKSIKEQLRRIPMRGLGYGMLRYMCRDSRIRQQMVAVPRAQISFNYLGQWDSVVGDSTLIAPAAHSVGRMVSDRGERSHAISVLSRIRKSCLEVSWHYSESAYCRETIEWLAETFVSSLHEIIAHCQSPEAGGFTPSDFPKARVSQASLDRLMAGMRKR